MKALVTGANGFLGKRLVDLLVAQGQDVVAVGRDIDRTDCKIEPVRFDEIYWDGLGAIDTLFHFAAINDTSITDMQEIERVNVGAALDCFGEAVNSGCSRIVYASTLHVYGRVPVPMREEGPKEPVSLYGTSKLFLEQSAGIFSRHTGVPCVGLRFANVYGPGEIGKGKMASQVLQVAQQMRKGNPKVFAPGTQERDFVYVDDAIKAAVAAAAHGKSEIFNCGSGEGTSFNTLIDLLNNALGLARVPEYIPEPPQYLSRVILDVNKARTELGHNPRGIREGIAAYLASGELQK